MPKTNDAPITIVIIIQHFEFTKRQRIAGLKNEKSRHFGRDFLSLITAVKLETYLLFVPEVVRNPNIKRL